MRVTRPLLLISCVFTLLPVPCRPADLVTTAIKQLADGRAELTITNNHQSPITAFVVLIQDALPTGAHGLTTYYEDNLLNPWHDKPIPPAGTRTIRFGGPGSNLMKQDFKLNAAIFEDGTTFGESAAVDGILAGRRTFSEKLGKAIALLQDGLAGKISRGELVQRATEMERSELPPNPRVEERRAVGNVFGTLRANLQNSPPDAPPDQSMRTVLRMFLSLRQAVLSSKPEVAPKGTGVNSGSML